MPRSPWSQPGPGPTAAPSCTGGPLTSGDQLAADEAAWDVAAPPHPVVDVDTAEYWAAAERGEFVLCRCTNCRLCLQPPMERCRRCGGSTAFEPATGAGTVHSFIVVRHPSVPAFTRLIPYAIVLDDLAEGVRMTGRFLGAPDDVRLGLPVTVHFERLPGAEHAGVVFAVDPDAGGPRSGGTAPATQSPAAGGNPG